MLRRVSLRRIKIGLIWLWLGQVRLGSDKLGYVTSCQGRATLEAWGFVADICIGQSPASSIESPTWCHRRPDITSMRGDSPCNQYRRRAQTQFQKINLKKMGDVLQCVTQVVAL